MKFYRACVWVIAGLVASAVLGQWWASAQQSDGTGQDTSSTTSSVREVTQSTTRQQRAGRSGQPGEATAGTEEGGKGGRRKGGRRPDHKVTSVGGGQNGNRVAVPSRGQVPAQGSGGFEPILANPVVFEEVPDEGTPITLDAAAQAVPIVELLDMISVSTGWNIVTTQGIEEKKVRFWVNSVTPRQAMEVLRFNGIYYRFNADTNFLYVMTREEHLKGEFGALQREEFVIKNADVIDMEAILQTLVSGDGKLVADPRSGRILVWDTEANIEEMRSAVARLDVPLEPRIIKLKYLEAEVVLDSVSTMLSERGAATADSRTNTIVVTDLPSRQDQVEEVLGMLDRKLETRTWTLDYAAPDLVVERLEGILPEELAILTYDEETHQVSVTTIPERLDDIDEILQDWDVKLRQVEIEAYLVAAETNVTRNLGVNWTYFDEKAGSPIEISSGGTEPGLLDSTRSLVAPGDTDIAQRISVGTLPYQTSLRNPLTNQVIYDMYGNPIPDPEFNGNRISALLDYLDRKEEVDVLARPRVTVWDGGEAVFEAVTDEPYQEGGYSQYGLTTTEDPDYNRVIPLRVEFIQWGTTLSVTPRINLEDNILMAVEAEDSTVAERTITVGDQNSTVPAKTQAKVETEVLVHDGQTIVIGGLRSASLNDRADKVPILGEIPLLGKLFRDTTKSHNDRELLVFITPTIVNELTQPEAERLADFEAATSNTLRQTQKPLIGRLINKIRKGKNEIGVSIGQQGDLHSEGELVTLEDLRVVFESTSLPSLKKVVIRQHPDAPPAIAISVSEAAIEAGLKVDYDNSTMPFVPHYLEE